MGGVRGVELQPELAEPECAGEPGRRQQRRESGRERLMPGRRDRKQRRIPPKRTRPGRDGRVADLRALTLTVVDRIEWAEAGSADTDALELVLRLTDTTSQGLGWHRELLS